MLSLSKTKGVLTVRVLILADNQDITREGLRAVACRQGLFDEVREAADQRELTERLIKAPEAVVVLDYALFDTTVEYLRILRARFRGARFMLFSEHLSDDFVRRMVYDSKAFSVVLKGCSLAEIEEAFRRLQAGGQFVCAAEAEALKMPEEDGPGASSLLTPTEKEILRAMSLGKTTKQIAAERFLSIYTVMTHRKNIFRKLGVNNVQEATRYALRAGVVRSGDYYI